MRPIDLRPIDLRPTWLVFKREFAAYFATPVAAVFLIVFLALAAGLTFFMTGFFDRGQADLSGFFFWHPWLFLVLMSAIAMRLWAEERRSGTIEILMTLPGAPWQIVLGKWLANNPKLLILDEPTRGIDVGAKAEIHRLMSQLAGEGVAILMISSEIGRAHV